jgi:hypothetical protein|tara:strand:+ start:2040 stop:2234 length:195 start_codon:yes stop_codon:yes gene_type:complete
MGTYEDLFYDITESIDSKGLRKEFDAQLDKMRRQDKHKYKDTRDRWSYAYDKVIRLHDKNNKKV